MHVLICTGVGGGAETVVLGEVTRTSDEKKRTGIISVLVAIRQTGLLIGMFFAKNDKIVKMMFKPPDNNHPCFKIISTENPINQ